MTTLEILIAARGKIEKEENWTQGAFCIQENGVTKYCASGTIRALGDGSLCSEAFERLLSLCGYDQVCKFNDTHTHAEVLDLFDRAIAMERTKEQANG